MAKTATGDGTTLRIRLTVPEIKTLVLTARYYERSMGIFRHAVMLTAPGEIKSKYRYVREESSWLQQFADAELNRAEASAAPESDVAFTPLAAIAFWGRLLSSLDSARSRRKLTREEASRRHHLADKLASETARLYGRKPRLVQDLVGTRRQREAGWMWAYLNPTSPTDPAPEI